MLLPNVANNEKIKKMKDKIKAFLIHLSISLLIAVFTILVVYGVWNPEPLYKATGVTHIFLLLLIIDIILGPLLTFIVYKKGKKTLKFDLIVIGLLQFGALIYGLYNVYEGRPAWIVYNIDRFDLIRANEIDLRQIDKAKSEYQNVSLTGAKYVTAIIPDNLETKQIILFEEIGSGIAPSQRPELYASLDVSKETIQKRAQSLAELNKYNSPEQVKAILLEYPRASGFLPLKANAQDMTVLINKETAEVIKIVDLRPW